MAILFKNNAASTLTYKMTDVQEVLYVADASVFPVIASDSGDVFKLTLVGDDTLEIVEAFEVYNSEGRQGFKIRRAQEGTTAQAWPAGTRVEMRITADALNSFVPTAVQLAKDYVDATGVASTTNVGFAGVDGQTTQADAGGVITAKDLAIGGDASDLASARGFFYDTYLPYYPGRGSNPVDDFNLLTLPGTYHIVVSRDTLNRPDIRLFTGSGTNDGILEITRISPASTVASHQRLNQRFTVFGSDRKTWSRNQDTNAVAWYAWEQELRTGDIGDGIRITNGIISVPEMEGATASANGVSGLVPPPLKADLGKSLGANGEWLYPADVAIGGDVSDLASVRGQIGDLSPIRIADLNTFLESGVYRVKWADDNNPGLNTPPGTAVNGIVYVASCKNAVGKITECRQIVYRLGTPGINDWNIFTREMMSGGTWSPWRWILTDASLGDGLYFTNGKVSVPNYEGATASTAGTSGLVPPAAAGEENFVLHGDGTYRPVMPSYEVLNNFRKSMIGMSFPFPSTTLPEGFVWADGSLILFEDYPEVKEKYEAGGFDGMLLAWDADEKTIAAKLGKWRPNAATPTGLFVPNWGGQFSRAWVPGQSVDAGREAGSFQRDELRAHVHRYGYNGDTNGFHTNPTDTAFFYSGDGWATTSTGGSETRPMNIAQPYAIYLGVIK